MQQISSGTSSSNRSKSSLGLKATIWNSQKSFERGVRLGGDSDSEAAIEGGYQPFLAAAPPPLSLPSAVRMK